MPSVTAPRQRGLKKPPPLRSMSTTQAPVSEKPELRRPLSLESASSEVQLQAEAAVLSQSSPVCREISAMSAAMMAESAGHTHIHKGFEKTSENKTKFVSSQGPGVPVYMRTNSNPNGDEDTTRPELLRRHSSEDAFTTKPKVHNFSNNNINTAVMHHPRDYQIPQGSEKENLGSSSNLSGLSRSSSTNSGFDLGTGSLRSQRAPAAQPNLYASFLAYLRDDQAHRGLENLSRFDDSIVVATLRNGIGEEFVLSAESFHTIIRVTRVLLTGMEASIIKLEAFPKEHRATMSNSMERNQSSSMPAHHYECPKYSKDKMLQLSRSVLSKQPPDSWRILSQAIPEVCLPANSVREYFDPADFHPPDGSLVVETISIKNRQEPHNL